MEGTEQIRVRTVVGDRRHPVPFPEARAARSVAVERDREHRLLASAQGVSDLDARTRAEHVVEGRRIAVEQERLVVVVHDEGAAGGQVGSRGLNGLGREQVVLEADGCGLARERRLGVGQRIQDQRVALVRVLEERPSVVDIDAHARALIGVLGVVLLPESHELGVDLDGVDVASPLRQGHADVVACARSDHEHVGERAACHVPVGKEVEGLDPVQRGDRVQGLVGDVVGRDRQPAVAMAVDGRGDVVRGDFVIGGPDVDARERFAQQHQHHGGDHDPLPPPLPGAREAPRTTRPPPPPRRWAGARRRKAPRTARSRRCCR